MSMDKIVRAITVGIFIGIATLIGLGWNAYGEMNSMGKTIKAEVKAEMIEVRNRDMEYINHRFNLVEQVVAGRVINTRPIPNAGEATK